jgi:hypothetical protein
MTTRYSRVRKREAKLGNGFRATLIAFSLMSFVIIWDLVARRDAAKAITDNSIQTPATVAPKPTFTPWPTLTPIPTMAPIPTLPPVVEGSMAQVASRGKSGIGEMSTPALNIVAPPSLPAMPTLAPLPEMPAPPPPPPSGGGGGGGGGSSRSGGS